MRFVSPCLLALTGMLVAAAGLRAQGGPPMITDDPGTPGDKHGEINLAWTDERTPGSTLVGLPLLDANYGVGDRIQLNYQASWNLLRDADAGTESGLSASQLAVKWRFYDAGETGLQASMYPRIFFLNPGDSDHRGTADPNTAFLLPFEVRKDFGMLAVNVDFGHMFSAAAVDRGWTGGVCIGREVRKGWEVDAEIHLETDDRVEATEAIADLGTRYDFSEHATLLLAAGRDLHNSLGPRVSLLTYVGIQLRI